MKSLSIAALVLATAAFMTPGTSNAQEFQQNASGVCQGALPVYDTLLRNRPLGIMNVGSTASYVSCSFMSGFGIPHDIVGIQIANPTAADVDVSCTIVTGRSSFDHTYYPVTLTYPAGAFGFLIQFLDPAVDPGTDLINASCLLPPGVELSYMAVVEAV